MKGDNQSELLKSLSLSRALSLSCSEALGEFMEGRGAVNPGILTLTTGLSKPFMRLDKYPTLLKELERHMEVGCVSVFVHISQNMMCRVMCLITDTLFPFRRVILTGQTFRSAWRLSKTCL